MHPAPIRPSPASCVTNDNGCRSFLFFYFRCNGTIHYDLHERKMGFVKQLLDQPVLKIFIIAQAHGLEGLDKGLVHFNNSYQKMCPCLKGHNGRVFLLCLYLLDCFGVCFNGFRGGTRFIQYQCIFAPVTGRSLDWQIPWLPHRFRARQLYRSNHLRVR